MECKRIEFEDLDGWMETYFPDNSPEMKPDRKRGVVLICPGGSYAYTSDREAEPVALQFCVHGFAACVLRYPAGEGVHFPQSLVVLARAVHWLRTHAQECRIDPDQITVCGFSAGGHLAGSLGVFWNEDFLSKETGLTAEEIRPNRLMLCYPVLTGGEFAHRGSFDYLLGEDADEASRCALSLEEHVSADVPPTFLWHTYTDPVVPVENSLMFAAALRRAAVPFELHVYSVGGHGLSLAGEETANTSGGGVQAECQGWIELACSWLGRDQ